MGEIRSRQAEVLEYRTSRATIQPQLHGLALELVRKPTHAIFGLANGFLGILRLVLACHASESDSPKYRQHLTRPPPRGRWQQN